MVVFGFEFIKHFANGAVLLNEETGAVNTIAYSPHEFLWPPNTERISNCVVFVAQ